MCRSIQRKAGPLLSILGVALVGCGGDAGSLANARSVTLNGIQVTTPTASSATATANLVVANDRQSITVTTQTTGLGKITGVHIHGGLTGTNGLIGYDAPIIFTLFDTTMGATNGRITRTLASPNLTQQTSAGISTFADAVNAILAGRAYVDFHTTAFPNGEIRGQILPPSFTAALTPQKVVPVSTATGSGNATVIIDAAAGNFTVTVSATGLDNTAVTEIGIRVGAGTANGPAFFNIFTEAQGPFTGTFTRTLTANDLVAQTSAGITDVYDAINAVLTGNAYVDIRTVANPTGALRGQLTPTVN